ncbi:MAG: hypothetical protein V1808_01195 [Candidatus Daviesbacteria bacterium]
MRKIFIVPAGSQQHFYDTIKRRRTIEEVRGFIDPAASMALNNLYHGKDFIVWGARNTQGNARCFQKMEPGDYIVMVLEGKAVLVGELSYKIHNPEMARYFWRTNESGETWENIYFIINENFINVPMDLANKYLGYSLGFRPQGLMAVEPSKQEVFEKNYGNIHDVFLSLDQGRELKEAEKVKEQIRQAREETSEEKELKTTEHSEMQWRLIRLGKAASSDIWVPKNDQGKNFHGNNFRDFVMPEFHEGLDIPPYVKNIDVVWKFGYQIKSAFEIEHSTSIYSGLLRLSDLKAITPNTIYPMYIVASRERKPLVFEQLVRPTFKYFHMDLDVGFLSYDVIRELDEKFSGKDYGFTEDILKQAAEKVA